MHFYTTMNKNEDLVTLKGQRFGVATQHVVKHRGHDIQQLRAAVQHTNQVIWLMEKRDGFYYFSKVIE